MTLHRIAILTTCLTLTVIGTACDLGDKSIGNDTGADQGETGDPGDGDGDGDGDDMNAGDGDCGDEVTFILDDPNISLTGFSLTAADYLALAEGTYLGDFSWLPNDGPVTIEHAGTTSPLTVSVTYEGGDIRLTEVELFGEFPNGNNGGFPCGNRLEIDVSLTFATEDGLFAETLTVPLLANSHSEVTQPEIYFELDTAAIAGQLSVDDFTIADGELSALVLTGNFDGVVLQGSLATEILVMDWVGFGAVANFDAVRAP